MAGLEAAFERIGAFLEHDLPRTHAAGVALAVTDRDEVLGVVVRGFADVASAAPVRPETRFEIGSISKSFASIVALQEVEAGRLDLHVSVNELLPELALPEPFGPITLHHLLTHSGGLAVGTEEAPTGPGALRRLRDNQPGFPPGEHFWYSNDGYKVVGAILERIVGQPMQDILRERVLAPLGMDSTVAAITNDVRMDLATGYEPMFDDRPPHTSHPLVPARWLVSNTADGSIVSNVIDMSAYARMLLNGGATPTGRLLTPESFALLTTPHMFVSEEPRWDYGYGLDLGTADGRPSIGHSGGMVGYTAYLLTEPGSGLGAMLMLNGLGSSRPPVQFAIDAVRAAIAGEPLPDVPEPPDPALVADAGEYAGRYRSERGREVEISGDDGRLRWREGALGVILERVPDARDAFFAPHPTLDRFLVHFGRDPDGRVVEILHGNDWLPGERWSGPEPDPHPAAWATYPGLYRSNNPWGPTVRVLLRKGKLVAVWSSDLEAEEQELVPLEGGRFHIGNDPWAPAWIMFDDPMNGKTVRAILDGGVWYRSFED